MYMFLQVVGVASSLSFLIGEIVIICSVFLFQKKGRLFNNEKWLLSIAEKRRPFFNLSEKKHFFLSFLSRR